MVYGKYIYIYIHITIVKGGYVHQLIACGGPTLYLKRSAKESSMVFCPESSPKWLFPQINWFWLVLELLPNGYVVIVGLPIKNGGSFHSYVKLPESILVGG